MKDCHTLADMIKAAVFLGNTGKKYERTRHNAGFMLADYLFAHSSWSVKFHSACTKAGSVYILKPLTLMNLSGTAAGEVKSFLRLENSEILVVHDDMELPRGCAKYQKGGGTKGHNGLKNIKERLGGEDFFRLRIGIGRPVHDPPSAYVLRPFSESEFCVLYALFGKIGNADILSCTQDFSLTV